jgi:hypothetical protein
MAGSEPEQRSVLREMRDMGTGGEVPIRAQPAAFLFPSALLAGSRKRVKTYGPLPDPDVVEMMDSATGQPLPCPSENDTAVTGERIGEGQQVTTQDANIGMVLFGAWKYSSRLVSKCQSR